MIIEATQEDPVKEFWKQIKRCYTDWDIGHYLLFKMVHQFREDLGDDHILARAIDAKEPMSVIADHADESGYADFAKSLRFGDRMFVRN